MPLSGPYILQSVNQTTVQADPDADLKLSPLWPLQQALRSGFVSATNSDQSTPQQTARVTAARADVESLFSTWRDYSSITKLRDAVKITITPPTLDLANDPLLSGFQSQLLALPAWSTVLPS